MIAKSLGTIACVALLGVAGAEAQQYSEKPITIIVPFAAGGPTDTVARLLGQAMGKTLGQTIIVENVGGAGGTMGAARVAKAPPDGYTIFLHHIGHATAPALYRKLPYDTVDDFEPIGLVTDVPMTLVAEAGLPAEGPQGADRLRQGEQGQGVLRQRRPRRCLAPVRHAVHERDRHRPDDGAVQGHRARR